MKLPSCRILLMLLFCDCGFSIPELRKDQYSIQYPGAVRLFRFCPRHNIYLERSTRAHHGLRRNWENWKFVEPKSEESHNRTIFDILQFGTYARQQGHLGNAGFVIILVSQKVPSPASRLIGLSSSKEMQAP